MISSHTGSVDVVVRCYEADCLLTFVHFACSCFIICRLKLMTLKHHCVNSPLRVSSQCKRGLIHSCVSVIWVWLVTKVQEPQTPPSAVAHFRLLLFLLLCLTELSEIGRVSYSHWWLLKFCTCGLNTRYDILHDISICLQKYWND